MNRSTSQRSEEARRHAMAALDEAKRQELAMLGERARMFESETQRVLDLRAKRVARAARPAVEVDVERAVEQVLLKARRA